MSSDRVTRPREPLRLRLLVYGLLAAHLGWIGVHMTLHAEGAINPWKLGGYAMYTRPHPTPLTHLYIFDEALGTWAEIPRHQGRFSSVGFDQANHLGVFRCRPPGEDAVRAFLDENPWLRGRPVTIVLSAVEFTRDPIGAKREAYATVQIGWGGEGRFGWQGEICGETFRGEGVYEAPR